MHNAVVPLCCRTLSKAFRAAGKPRVLECARMIIIRACVRARRADTMRSRKAVFERAALVVPSDEFASKNCICKRERQTRLPNAHAPLKRPFWEGL